MHVYCNVLCCTVLYSIVLYCTVLYCTVLYCTVLYCHTHSHVHVGFILSHTMVCVILSVVFSSVFSYMYCQLHWYIIHVYVLCCLYILFIAHRHHGNTARFIRRSCNPNAEVHVHHYNNFIGMCLPGVCRMPFDYNYLFFLSCAISLLLKMFILEYMLLITYHPKKKSPYLLTFLTTNGIRLYYYTVCNYY